jgi:hypothetical protein
VRESSPGISSQVESYLETWRGVCYTRALPLRLGENFEARQAVGRVTRLAKQGRASPISRRTTLDDRLSESPMPGEIAALLVGGTVIYNNTTSWHGGEKVSYAVWEWDVVQRAAASVGSAVGCGGRQNPQSVSDAEALSVHLAEKYTKQIDVTLVVEEGEPIGVGIVQRGNLNIVSSVEPGTAAAAHGVQVGAVLQTLNGEVIRGGELSAMEQIAATPRPLSLLLTQAGSFT